MSRFGKLAAILWLATLGFAGDQSWEDWVRMAYESWTAGDRANALELWERAYHDPENANHPETMATVEFNRATALLWFGRIGEAEAGFLRALTRQESLYGQSSPGVASTLHCLALLCVRAGRPQEAKSWSKRALEIQKALYGAQHPSVASTLNILAEVLMTEGRQREAVSAQQEAITICERTACSDWLMGVMLGNLGRMLGASDATRGQAEEFCLRGRLILEKTLGARHPYVALAFTNVAELDRRNGKYGEAEAMLRNALDIQREVWPPTHPDTAKTLFDLAWVMAEQRRFSEAASFFEQAAVMREALFGPDSLYMAETLGAYAAVLRKTGHRKQAAAYSSRAQAIAERDPAFRRRIYSVDVRSWERKQSK
jgi:tetratricopeptide (TPR) repeat protein